MADRVDAAVEAMKVASIDQRLDDPAAQPKLQQLPAGNDPMLRGRKRRHRSTTWQI
jgi:hypothetical protein